MDKLKAVRQRPEEGQTGESLERAQVLCSPGVLICERLGFRRWIQSLSFYES